MARYEYGLARLGRPAGFVLIAAASLAAPVRRVRCRLDGMAMVLAPVAPGARCLGIEIWDHFHRVQTVALVAASLGLVAVIGRLMLTFREYLGLSTDARRVAEPRLDGSRQSPCARPPPRRVLRIDWRWVLSSCSSSTSTASRPTTARSATVRATRCAAARQRGSAIPSVRARSLSSRRRRVLHPRRGIQRESAVGGRRATASLRESGDAFAISCSSGYVLLPDEAENTHDALQVADRRMYAEKGLGVGGGESRGVLLQALGRTRRVARRAHEPRRQVFGGAGRGLGSSAASEALPRGSRLHDR